MHTPLTKHYSNASVAASRSRWFDRLNCSADQHALDCAALHVGIDCMARIQAKRKPQAGCAASYPPIVRRDAETVAHSLFRVLNRHVCEVMDAERRRTERLTLTVRADAVGRHYAQAMLR